MPTSRFPSPAAPRRHTRAGTTTIEQLVVLALLGVIAAIAVTSGASLLAAAAVDSASRETANLFAFARDRALAGNVRTAVRLDEVRQRVVVHQEADTVASADFRARGVNLQATRDSMAYAPSGLGVGAANLRVVLRRGAHSDTITVSRLGRVAR